ncbi:heparin lyase I family protein [Streptomyces sp. bgisy082]|uniref:heparin lyase I family protein n=1 Tax=Streptomyces sp. bgisy082 TaxID=3413776 RepID=UPI003D73DE1D
MVMVGVGATEAHADRKLTPLPFEDGFESGVTTAFARKGIDGTGTVSVTAAPGGRGGKAVRLAMPDDGKSHRTEIATERVPYGSYRYTFANYLPGDWIRYDAQTIVSQWHGGTGTFPAVVLAVRGDRWMMVVHWKMSSEQVDESRKPAHEVKYDLGPVRLGRWNQWSFDITWSTARTPGSITASLDGAEVGSHHGPNSYHQDTAPYHKIGLYRPNWQAKKGHKAGGTADVVNYYDDVTITPISPGTAEPPTKPTPTPTPSVTATPSPDLPTASASPSGRATGSAPATAPTTTAPTAPGSGTADEIPVDTDTDTDNTAAPLPATGVSDRTPLILAFGGTLLAAGLLFVLRARARTARRRAVGHRE